MVIVWRVFLGALYAAIYWCIAWGVLHIAPEQSDPVEVLMGLVAIFGFHEGSDTVTRGDKP